MVRGAVTPDEYTMQRIRQGLRALPGSADTIDPQGHPLWTIIRIAFTDSVPGQVVRHPYLEMIRTLATTAPVCALVKPHVGSIVNTISSGGSVSIGDFEQLHRHSPVLARFLKACGAPCGAGLLPNSVLGLLRCMIARANAAYESVHAATQVTSPCVAVDIMRLVGLIINC